MLQRCQSSFNVHTSGLEQTPPPHFAHIHTCMCTHASNSDKHTRSLASTGTPRELGVLVRSGWPEPSPYVVPAQ
eukprot:1140036-Pelagomonas_calceolata.AAC.2